MSDDDLKAMFQTLRQDNVETRRHFEELRQETRQQFDEMRRESGAAHAETRSQLEGQRQETRQQFAEMREENGAAHAETRRRVEEYGQENAAVHADTRTLFETVAEGLRHDIQLVAEGVVGTRDAIEDLRVRIEGLEGSMHS